MPEWFFLAVVFIFGLVIGSFLNVVSYRFHTGRSLNGSSHCESCGHKLRWFELFPLLSFLALRGRCGACHSRIRFEHALVELATGLLFVLAYLLTSEPLILALNLLFVSILVVVFVYDLRHMIIPDELALSLAVVALLLVSYQSWMIGSTFPLWWAASGSAVAFMFFAALWWYSGGRWLGFGDAKLSVSLGLMVGMSGAFSLIVFAFWIGAIISVGLLMFQRFVQTGAVSRTMGRVNMKSEVPFAPFLILAFVLVYFFNADVLSLIEWVYGIA